MPADHSYVFDTFARLNLKLKNGEGAWLFNDKGEKYLDFIAGVAVNAFGYGHPYLLKTLQENAQKPWHVSNFFQIEAQEKLAQRLCENSFADKVFFVNSGAEAVETAIKTARHYHYANQHPKKNKIICFEGGFHGRTLATIAAGGQKKYLEGFDPIMPGFLHVPFGDIDALAKHIDDTTAAILFEPIQAEGGVRVLSEEKLNKIRELCDKNNILLILDEVQSGMGRTGKLFAHQWSKIQPDIMALAKALGGGLPVGACLAKKHVAESMVLGTHGSTFGGNPLSMAMANAVLDLLLKPKFLEHVQNIAQHFSEQLGKLVENYNDLISNVSGKGLLIGIQCVKNNQELINACFEQKLLIVNAGQNMVRFLPPLILTEEEAQEGLARFEKALKSLQ